jgi:hypothetical protein
VEPYRSDFHQGGEHAWPLFNLCFFWVFSG